MGASSGAAAINPITAGTTLASGGLDYLGASESNRANKSAYNTMLHNQQEGRDLLSNLATQSVQQGSTDYQRLLDAANGNNQIAQSGISTRSQERAANLKNLSDILVNQQNQQLMNEVPQLAEQANLKGIFRSTGMGNSVAQKQAILAQQTSSDLQKQSVADEAARVAEQQAAEGGLISGRQAATGRQLSLEDYARSLRQGIGAGMAGNTTLPYVGQNDYQMIGNALNNGIARGTQLASVGSSKSGAAPVAPK